MSISAQPSGTAEEKEVMATLEALWDAIAKQDLATVNRIYHDDLSYGHSTASIQAKDEAVKGMSTWQWLKLKSHTVRVTGPVAIVRTVMDFRIGSGTRTMNVTDMNVLYVLVKQPRGWQVIIRQAIKGPDSVVPTLPPA